MMITQVFGVCLLHMIVVVISSGVVEKYSCSFDGTLCNWSHDLSLPMNWTMTNVSTPSSDTGPDQDASGSGSFLYIDAIHKQYGEAAGLISPMIRGPHCMTFMYHMYGAFMGSIMVYIKTSKPKRPVWVKSLSQGNKWIQARVQLNDTEQYQVLLRGIKSSAVKFGNNAAIDEVKIRKGRCKDSVRQWFHVYLSQDTKRNQVDTKDLDGVDAWYYQFSFLSFQTQIHQSQTLFFIYPVHCIKHPISTLYPAKDARCKPVEFFFASSIVRNVNESAVLLVDRLNGTSSQGIRLEGHRDQCCGENVKSLFYAKTAIKVMNRCSPDWIAVGSKCIRFFPSGFRSGYRARTTCIRFGGRLATPSTISDFNSLRRYLVRDNFRLSDIKYQYYLNYHLGASAIKDNYHWLWANRTKVTGDILSVIKDESIHKQCGVLRRKSRKWELAAESCTALAYSVCSKDENNLKACGSGWTHVNSTCFALVNFGMKRTWEQSMHLCRSIGSVPVIIDNTDMIKVLGRILDPHLRNSDAKIFVGLKYLPELLWEDGQPIASQIRNHISDLLSVDTSSCVALSYSFQYKDWRMEIKECDSNEGFICQMNELNQAYRRSTFYNTTAVLGHPSYVLDGNYATCYQTTKSQSPWLRIKLAKAMYVAKVEITNRRSCCLETDTSFEVLLGNSSSTHCTKYHNVYRRKSIVFVCSHPMKTTDVTLQIIGVNRILTLCEVKITAYETHNGLKGMFQETWFDLPSTSLKKFRDDLQFSSQPDALQTSKDFDAPVLSTDYYGMRMTAYLQVPVSGKYTLYIASDVDCELWFNGRGMTAKHDNKHKGKNAKMILKLDSGHRVGHNEWHRYPSVQTSKPLLLSHCYLYKLEMFMKQYNTHGFASVAIRLPNGTLEGPIRQDKLYWVYPGFKEILFTIDGYSKIMTQEASQRPMLLKAFYKHCCHGAYCPGCPAKVYFDVLNTSFLVNESLAVDCKLNVFHVHLNIMVQPGSYPMKIKYQYIGDVSGEVREQTVGHLIVLPRSVLQCNFTKDTCMMKNEVKKSVNKWSLVETSHGQYLSVANAHQSGWLESKWIQSDRFMRTVGVCLSFEFILPTLSHSSLEVLLKTSSRQNGSVIWNLRGYHGDKWSKAQVSWKAVESFKIIFVGKAVDNNSVGLDSVKLMTSTCSRLPVHSEPGHKCNRMTEFQCANGQCIDKDLVCDGDSYCIDGSDEKNCTCLSNTFSCPNGGCLKPSQLCDGKKDCDLGGLDESRCDKTCPEDHFQCVSGSCVLLSLTCDGQSQCEDGTDEPDLCGMSGCPLNNISCRSSQLRSLDHECAFSKVHCDFEGGSFCSLIQDDSRRDFAWQLGSGSTPTKNTGPSFDHTTLTTSGKYIYVEVSNRKPGDKAILTTDFINGGQPVCVRFWYHMSGAEVGSLNVYYKTNRSQVLLWKRQGHVGNEWLFGQTSFKITEMFKVVFEGITGSGAHGDIALDDLTISYDSCLTRNEQEIPSCYFEQEPCHWAVSKGWTLTNVGKRPLKYDWKRASGGYIYISSLSTAVETITSPLISTHHNLKCIRLWYFLSNGKIYGSEISVQLVAGSLTVLLWRSSTEITTWQYVQLPLTYHTDFQVIIKGKRASLASKFLLDDITFSPESCSQIPRAGEGYSNTGAKRHWKLDGFNRDLRTFGTMSYYHDSGYPVAYFNGISGYLESPAIDFYSKDFSVVCWVYVMDIQRVSFIYSDYPSYINDLFVIYVYLGGFCVQLRLGDSARSKTMTNCADEITNREWTMIGFTWNHQKRELTLYRNGQFFSRFKGEANLKFKAISNDTFYEIGIRKDTKQLFHGLMRDLMVFTDSLPSALDMLFLYSPSRVLCPVRQTTKGDCCVFPFIYNGVPRYTCVKGDSSYWCATTSNYDTDRIWGICEVSKECNSVKDGWCGWRNTTSDQWILGKANEMKTMKLEVDNLLNGTNWINSTEPSSDAYSDFEISFPEGHSSYIKITEGIPDMISYTVCMWVKTADQTNAGTAFLYRTRYTSSNKLVLAIGLIDYGRLRVVVSGKQTVSNFRYNTGKWHHVCLRWNGREAMMHLNLGKTASTRKKVNIATNKITPGSGELLIGLTKLQSQEIGEGVGQFVGNINNFNLWSRFLSDEDVNWMATACGDPPTSVLGHPVVSWSTLRQSFVGQVKIIRPATCKEFEGPRILLNLSSSNENPSIHESPLFNRSSNHPKVCLRFSYIIYSPVQQTLRIYQLLKLDNYQPRLVWIVNTTRTTNIWKYAEVPISGVSEFKLQFKGQTRSTPGYIAVKEIHLKNGFCSSVQKKGICHETRKSLNGNLSSPLYPSTYDPNTHCTWRIQVDSKYIVRLYFMYFELEDHPACHRDYVSVHDGKKVIGRYCGRRYPEFVESTGNTMIVSFQSNNEVERSGFKARYEALPIDGRTKEACMSYKGCPAGCECDSFLSRQDYAVVIKSKKDVSLTAIPVKLPTETVVLQLGKNRISRLLNSDLAGANSKKLEYLDLSFNILIDIQRRTLYNLNNLKVMRLNSNFLRSIPSQAFSRTINLKTLDLSDNLITKVDSTLFASLTSLTSLSLRSNKLSSIDGTIFANNENLTALYLDNNNLEFIPDGLFLNQNKLKILYLNNNKIKKFTMDTFKGLTSIEKLFLQSNNPIELAPGIFQTLPTLKELKVDDFFICCYASQALRFVKCDSPKEFFSSCSDLMKNKTLQVFIWVLGLSALLGNLFVIVVRARTKEDNKIHSFLFTNLATADFLMGVYMLFIAIKDVQFQGEYFKHDFSWRNGVLCRIAGALSLLSSEVSVLLLTLITADRFKNIVFPFRGRKLSYKAAWITVTAIWLVCLVLSVLPMVKLTYFYDQTRRVGYYGRSALCLPLQLTKDKLAGWEYSVAIFIALNLLSFVFILCAYIAMFITVTRSSRAVRSTATNKESQLAKRMAFIIATDFCCWIPVIVIAILSLLGLFHDPEQIVYAWLAVFVLPLNSAINPFLYTFSTSLYFNKFMNISINVNKIINVVSNRSSRSFELSDRPRSSSQADDKQRTVIQLK